MKLTEGERALLKQIHLQPGKSLAELNPPAEIDILEVLWANSLIELQNARPNQVMAHRRQNVYVLTPLGREHLPVEA